VLKSGFHFADSYVISESDKPSEKVAGLTIEWGTNGWLEGGGGRAPQGVGK